MPETREVLARQRNRWQRGLADTLWRHKKMLFNPTYGRLGFFAMPFFFFIEMLGPILEVGGIVFLFLSWVFDALELEFVLVFLAASIMLGMVLSIASVLCEEYIYKRYPNISHIFTMYFYALIENFGYRQMHSWWRLMGLVDFMEGNKSWGEMTRKGFGNQQPSAAPQYYLVLGTFRMQSNALRMQSMLGGLRDSSTISVALLPSNEPVYRLSLGRFDKTYMTWRLRKRYGFADDQFPDAYTAMIE